MKTPPTIAGCDNACHLGGFLLGLLLAWVTIGFNEVVGVVIFSGLFLLIRWLRNFCKEG